MIPTIGRIVQLSAQDAGDNAAAPVPKNPAEGDIYPATRVGRRRADQPVFYDGAGSHWARSRRAGRWAGDVGMASRARPGQAGRRMTDELDALVGELAEFKVRGGHDWFRLDHDVRTDEAVVEIYDEIGMWGVTAADFTAALDALPKSTKTINLRINSPGGGVFAGLTIANRLRAHKATVNVTVDGVAASIASVIAMAGDHVTMARGSQMMIHNPSGVVLGGAADMRKMADVLDQLARDSIADAYRAKAGGEIADWLDRMAAESWYGPAEAVAVGLADIADADPATDEPAARAVFDLTAYGFSHPGRDAAPDPAAADRARRSRAAVARVRGLREESK
jgi:ATP-dependent protease ClpP protease subunit